MKPEHYAQALFELSKQEKNPQKMMDAFVHMLKEKNALGLLPQILRHLQAILARASRNAPVLTLARQEDESTVREEIAPTLKHAEIDPADVTVKIDDTLIGGYRLEYPGNLIDTSYKNQLLQIYRKITAQ